MTAKAARSATDELPAVFLPPGALLVSASPCAVGTILGSCVSVCMWDSVLGLGGVSHYLLPHWVGSSTGSARFGNIAIASLIDDVVALGGERSRLRARVFGGACVLEVFRGNGDHLGARNVEVARRMLAQERIHIVEEDVGGRRGRKLVFHTHDGTAIVRPI